MSKGKAKREGARAPFFFAPAFERAFKARLTRIEGTAQTLAAYWREDKPHRDIASVEDIAEELAKEASELLTALRAAIKKAGGE